MAKVQKKKSRNEIIQSKPAVLERIKLHAAGVDVGSEEIYVAVMDEKVRNFSTYTSSLQEAVKYIRENDITSIAMEATGIYWFPIYELFEEEGLEVFVVNGAHVKNVPGRKTDVLDSEWLRELHTFGLLRSSFIPDEEIRKLRYYMRLRSDHIRVGASYIQHIQKNFDAMNIKLHNVISNIMGKSGLAIIRAILAGERDPKNLVRLCSSDMQLRKGTDVIKSLEGQYKDEYIFGIKQALEIWEIYEKKIEDCDQEIEKVLTKMTEKEPTPEKISAPKEIKHHKPKIKDLHLLMMKLTNNKDATQIAGINDYSLLQLISETGLDLNKWPTSKHFTSWLGLAPKVNKSGKQGKKKQKFKNRVNNAGQIFKQLARNVGNGKHCALAGFYRRIKSRSGASIANKAIARKIAVYYYDLMTKGFEFVDEGIKKYEKRYEEQIRRSLERKAKELGFMLIKA